MNQMQEDVQKGNDTNVGTTLELATKTESTLKAISNIVGRVDNIQEDLKALRGTAARKDKMEEIERVSSLKQRA